jgi:hypothetical protein
MPPPRARCVTASLDRAKQRVGRLNPESSSSGKARPRRRSQVNIASRKRRGILQCAGDDGFELRARHFLLLAGLVALVARLVAAPRGVRGWLLEAFAGRVAEARTARGVPPGERCRPARLTTS